MSLDTASLLIGGEAPSDDLLDLLTGIRIDAGADAVAQLVCDFDDNSRLLDRAGLLTAGTIVDWRGGRFAVAGVGGRFGNGSGIGRTVVARSALARSLRTSHRAAAERNTSPGAWMARRAATAGGRAVCQPSSSRELILQIAGDRRESDLDVAARIGRRMGWSWAEWGGTIRYGSRWWALTGGPAGQATHAVTWSSGQPSDAYRADLDDDSDDIANTATGSLDVPYDLGASVAPWDLLDLEGFEGWDGLWLVDRVQFTADLSSPVTVEVSRPRPPTSKAGSKS